ncbi:MAG: hybrid sensor histidine kinase/response regulator [Cyanobacteria bacterium J06639_1]
MNSPIPGSTMWIEDDELRSLYKISSGEHLQTLEDGLLHLEKHPHDQERITELMRVLHTLKGDSRMVGVTDAETLTHQIEDMLGEVKRGERPSTPELYDRLHFGLDSVRKIADEAVTGEPSQVQVFYVLTHLMGAEDGDDDGGALAALTEEALPPEPTMSELLDSTSTEVAAAEAEAAAADADFLAQFHAAVAQMAEEDDTEAEDPVFIPEPVEPEPVPAAAAPPERREGDRRAGDRRTGDRRTGDRRTDSIDTIRVPAQKLDELMTQASELAVTKRRFSDRLSDIRSVAELWEDWSQIAFVNRAELDALERRLPSEELQPIRQFYTLAERNLERLGSFVRQLQETMAADTARLEVVTTALEDDVQSLRRLPLSTIFNLYPRMVRDTAKSLSKEVELEISGGDLQVDKRILEEIRDPLLHLIRNAIDHGLESPSERLQAGKTRSGTVQLRGYQTAGRIHIEISDDGRGLDLEKVKQTALRRNLFTEAELDAMSATQVRDLIFASGFSTQTTVTELSGRGVGLDVVRTHIEDKLKGSVRVESSPFNGTTFHLSLVPSLSTTFVLLVEVNATPYALPIEYVHTMMSLAPSDIYALEGRSTTTLDDRPVPVLRLSDILELPLHADPNAASPCVVLDIGSDRVAVLVDALLDRQEIVLKPQSKLLQRVRNISGATILGSGDVCMVLNPPDFVQASCSGASAAAIASDEGEASSPTRRQPSILLVEDSIIIRTQLKRLLATAGYTVTAAVDGKEGFETLQAHPPDTFDAVVSDVQMPNLDGLGLTARIRQFSEYDELPVILVTTLATPEDKQRGADAGANAYLTKGDFDQQELFDTLRRLI